MSRHDDVRHREESDFSKEDPVLWDLLGLDAEFPHPGEDFAARVIAASRRESLAARRSRRFLRAATVAAAALLVAGVYAFFERDDAGSKVKDDDRSVALSPIDDAIVDDLLDRLEGLSSRELLLLDLTAVEIVSDEYFGG